MGLLAIGIMGMLVVIALVIVLVNFIGKKEFSESTLTDVDKYEQRKSRVEFQNKPYLCENNDCNTKFFRMYQVFDAYKRRDMTIPGDPYVNEKQYSDYMDAEVFEEMGLVRCPTCHSRDVRASKEYSWMKKEPDMEKITHTQLKRRTKKRNDKATEKHLLKTLATIEKNIDEIEDISAYQYRYSLVSPIDDVLFKHIDIIREQLQRINTYSTHDRVKKKAKALINQLDKKGTDRFSILPAKNKPTSDNKIINETIEQHKNTHETNEYLDKLVKYSRYQKTIPDFKNAHDDEAIYAFAAKYRALTTEEKGV